MLKYLQYQSDYNNWEWYSDQSQSFWNIFLFIPKRYSSQPLFFLCNPAVNLVSQGINSFMHNVEKWLNLL